MTRFRMYIVMVFTVALVGLAGVAIPSAAAATTVHCESTGGGTFVCDTSLVRPLYYWTAGSNASITQNLGATARGTCTIGTKPTVSVTAYYRLSNTVSNTTPRPVTASTSFSCTAIAL
jgi:hypothetical protein